MAEIEAELDAEDDNLISIDHRYVKAIEEENSRVLEENSRLCATIAHMKMEQMHQQQMYQQMCQQMSFYRPSV
jgi:predicted acetyltransferase